MQMVRKKKKPSTSYTNSFWADSFSYQPTQRGPEKKKTAVLLFQKKNCHTLVLAEDERRKQG